MVLDPISALGLASNILQFVDFAGRLISTGTQYYKSVDGTLIEHVELSAIGTGLNDLNRRLETSLQKFDPESKLSEAEQGLQRANAECRDVSAKFVALLGTLKVSSKKQRWGSFRHACRTVWSEGDIERMSRKMSEAREQLMIHLLVHLSQQQTTDARAILKAVTPIQKNILRAIQESHLGLQTELRDLSASLATTRKQNITTIIAGWQQKNQEGLTHLSSQLRDLTEDDKIAATKEKMLDNFYFTQIKERRSRIPRAHEETFNWIFKTPDEAGPKWDDFVGWLADDSTSLYWISGKPGSGKSTLMRYLVEDPRTKEHLMRWTGAKSLLIASCFFWKPGTAIQKSLSGLLRALLYQLLTQYPDVMPDIDPWRWRAFALGADSLDDRTDLELSDTLHKFIEQTRSAVNVVLFVDGLDEFDGNDAQRLEMCQLLLDLSRYPHVKSCVSSRPWNIFKDTLSGCPTLRLEVLTQTDVRKYVEDALQAHIRFSTMQKLEEQACRELIDNIVEKASGVFLWVFLVVQELLIALRDGASSLSLRRRLERIPLELESYFLRILESVRPADKPAASALFQVMLRSRPPVTLVTLSFLEEPDITPALSPQLLAHKVEVLRYRNESMARRLNAYTMGLLQSDQAAAEKKFLQFRTDDQDWTMADIFRPKVEYLHRTVVEFLLTEETQRLLQNSTNGTFDTELFLCQAFLAQAKFCNTAISDYDTANTMRVRWHTRDDLLDCLMDSIEHLMSHAQIIESVSGKCPMEMLEEAETIFTTLLKYRAIICPPITPFGRIEPTESIIASTLRNRDTWHNSFLTMSLQFGLASFFMVKIDKTLLATKSGKPFLNYALCPLEKVGMDYLDKGVPNPEVVAALLKLGADGSQIFDGGTALDRFCLYMARMWKVKDDPKWAQVMELLILHGVSFTIRLPGDSLESIGSTSASFSRVLDQLFDAPTAQRLKLKTKETRRPKLQAEEMRRPLLKVKETRRPLHKRAVSRLSRLLSGKTVRVIASERETAGSLQIWETGLTSVRLHEEALNLERSLEARLSQMMISSGQIDLDASE